jgi:hypothetical protein
VVVPQGRHRRLGGRKTFSWYGSSGPEDLYAVPGGLVYGNTEHTNARYVFWRSFAAIFG